MSTYIDLSQFGYLKETYDYMFNTKLNVNNMIYTVYDKNGKEEWYYNIDIHECMPRRRRYDSNSKCIEDIRIPRFTMDLGHYNNDAKASDMIVYTYHSAKEKNDTTYKVEKPDKDGMELWINRDYSCVYNINTNEFRTYEYSADDKDLIDFYDVKEIIMIDDYGNIICDTINDNVTVMKNNSVSKMIMYKRQGALIDALTYNYSFKDSYICDNEKRYYVTQDDIGLISSVKCETDNDLLYSRYEVRDLHNGYAKRASIYPTLITPNSENYKSDLLKLWNIDDVTVSQDGHIIAFTRSVYDISKPKSVLHEIRSNGDILRII